MKKILLNILGPKGFAIIRSIVVWFNGIRIKNLNTSIQWRTYGERKYNCFFGYYDIAQFSMDEKKILAQRVSTNANPLKDDAEIGYYEIGSNNFVPLTKTQAWCWQQGARLRWHPICQEQILYNDIEDGRYVCRVFDIDKKKIVQTYDRAFYDISSDFSYGLSLNYSRLQRLRPGYGYNRLDDQTVAERIPQNDGIYKVDLQTGNEKLLISYERLSHNCKTAATENHYINHISISPNGSKFMFFHVVADENNMKWKTRLFVSDKDGQTCKLVEDRYVVSHYCWKNDQTLLITAIFDGQTFYEEIDLSDMSRQRIVCDQLRRDGHPTYLKQNSCIITDTYPNLEGIQTVLYADIYSKEVKTLASIKHYPFLFGEKRCDLHPRVANSNRYIAVDTLYKGKNREMIVFSLAQ